jgi:hypothetical protein
VWDFLFFVVPNCATKELCYRDSHSHLKITLTFLQSEYKYCDFITSGSASSPTR